MSALAGRAPSPGRRQEGCAFAPRCEFADDGCRAVFPLPTEECPGHTVRCYHPRSAPTISTMELPARAAVAASEHPALVLRDVCGSYAGKQVVHHVDLHVELGECLALVGDSGSGKTTLSRSVGGLHKEWTGEIRLQGKPLATSAQARSVGSASMSSTHSRTRTARSTPAVRSASRWRGR
jgi:peptide/nickel transport system ATP-binding protein